MIDAVVTFSIRHRGLVILAALVLAVLGAWAAWETPVDAIPDLSENQVLVFAEWKGHGQPLSAFAFRDWKGQLASAGEDRLIHFSGVAKAEACTIVLRGASA